MPKDPHSMHSDGHGYGHGNGKAALPSAESLRHGHETTDASVRGLTWFIILFCLGVALSLVLCWGVLRLEGWYEVANSGKAHPMDTQAVYSPPPQLQPSPGHEKLPPTDLAELRKEKMDQITRYAHLSANYDQIPVDRAIDILAAKGLPVNKKMRPVPASDQRLMPPTRAKGHLETGKPTPSEIEEGAY